MSVEMGVIGVGVWGEAHCIAYKISPNAKLIAICDLIPEKAKVLAEMFRQKLQRLNLGMYCMRKRG